MLVEDRSRAYCEARQRAGVLEDGSVALLREAGLAGRLDREGLEHGGIYLQFAGRRHHIDFRELTGPDRHRLRADRGGQGPDRGPAGGRRRSWSSR